jgi:hypothetical protein
MTNPYTLVDALVESTDIPDVSLGSIDFQFVIVVVSATTTVGVPLYRLSTLTTIACSTDGGTPVEIRGFAFADDDELDRTESTPSTATTSPTQTITTIPLVFLTSIPFRIPLAY